MESRPFENLRLASLGVIDALVKTDDQEVITFLLKTQFIPICTKIMEIGSEPSKIVATFILQKILLDYSGLSLICKTHSIYSRVVFVLSEMVSGSLEI